MNITIGIGVATMLAAAIPVVALARDRGEPARPGQTVERRDLPRVMPQFPPPPAAPRQVLHDDGGNDGRSRYFASPEERQQLRRDINAAGRELYRRDNRGRH